MPSWLETVEDFAAGSFSEDKGKATATRVFKVQLNADTNQQVPLAWVVVNRVACGLPAYNSSYSSDYVNLRAIKYTPKYDGDSYDIVTVEVGYDYNVWEGVTPVGKRKFAWSSRSRSEEYFFDTANVRSINTAGVPYPQNLKRDIDIKTVKMTFNVDASATYASYAGWVNELNQGGITVDGYSVGDGKLKVTAANLSEVQEEAGYQYKVASIDAEIDERGYDQEVDSRGHQEYIGGKLKDIAKGDPLKRVEFPWPLSVTGSAKALASDAPATRTHKPYYRVSMAGLFA